MNKNFLHDLAHTESRYHVATKNGGMPDDLFDKIRLSLQDVINHYHPSGSSGRLGAYLKGVEHVFKVFNVSQETYYAEVWVRNNRKSLGNYNDKKVLTGV